MSPNVATIPTAKEMHLCAEKANAVEGCHDVSHPGKLSLSEAKNLVNGFCSWRLWVKKYVNIPSEKYIYVHKYVYICVYTYLCKMDEYRSYAGLS